MTNEHFNVRILSAVVYCLLTLVATYAPPAKANKANFKETYVSVDTGTGELHGTLTFLTGDNDESVSAVALIIAGSGPTNRDGNSGHVKSDSLKLLAYALAEHNIASLRYDKRGVGESAGAAIKESDLRFEHYIEDARSWVYYLNKLPKLSNTQLVIIGHSEGSLIGMIAARVKGVDKYVSLAGAGEGIGNVIEKQLSAQPAFVMNQAKPILDSLVEGNEVEEVPPFLLALFRPSVQPYMISWLKYDPAKELKKLEKPTLILQGTTDIQVGLKQGKMLADASPQAKLINLEGMNHIFKRAPADRAKNIATYSNPELPIVSGLTEALVEFVKR
ncbi:MAG: alpha/beta hydrolase [Thalassotalea sp.]|nr:alpha/beta hydrolase [Thalassotalea sp.]